MLMVLGLFVFERRTLPYQSMVFTKDYRWASNERIGKPKAWQYLGEGETSFNLSGLLYPELTGGRLSLKALELMANEGRAWQLIAGTGIIHGMFIIEKVTHTHSDFYNDGTARKINFTLELKRVDESLMAMFGDLRTQAEELVTSARSSIGGLVG